MTDTASAPRVPKRVAAVILNSLKGGVVPRIGLPYITVGREVEIRALLTDLALIADGGASFRFLVGRYGAGKSFLLQTIRTHAMGENFVVADADLSPERRLQGGQGQGLATYRELIRNLSTKTRPEGGALTLVLDRWVAATGDDATGEDTLAAQMAPLEELVHGFDFTRMLRRYRAASLEGDDETKSCVIKWLRGEYRTKSEARTELGTTTIITDDDWYDYIKLFAQFLVGAGYKGLLVLIDELVNLFKIPNTVTRQYNYEKILTMYNDTLQGKAHHLGVIMGGTPQSIEDRRRGVFSYEALSPARTCATCSPPSSTCIRSPTRSCSSSSRNSSRFMRDTLGTSRASLSRISLTSSRLSSAAWERIRTSPRARSSAISSSCSTSPIRTPRSPSTTCCARLAAARLPTAILTRTKVLVQAHSALRRRQQAPRSHQALPHATRRRLPSSRCRNSELKHPAI